MAGDTNSPAEPEVDRAAVEAIELAIDQKVEQTNRRASKLEAAWIVGSGAAVAATGAAIAAAPETLLAAAVVGATGTAIGRGAALLRRPKHQRAGILRRAASPRAEKPDPLKAFVASRLATRDALTLAGKDPRFVLQETKA